MPWFRLDDKSAFHAKVIAAGNQAWGAFCRAGAWSSDHGTDGLIPPHVAKAIEPSPKVWARLREVGLLDEVDGATVMHDFLSWNPSAEQVEAKRIARAEAGSRGGRERSKRQATPKQLLGPELPVASDTVQANSNPSSQFPVPSSQRDQISPSQAPVPKVRRGTPEEAAPPSDHRALSDHYCAVFESIHGKRPTFTGREGKSNAKLLDALGLTEAKRRIDNAFADPFWSKKVTLNVIANEPDKFATASLPLGGRGFVQPAAPPGEPTWTERGAGNPDDNPENWMPI